MSEEPPPLFNLPAGASQRLAEAWGAPSAATAAVPLQNSPPSTPGLPLRPLWKKKRFWVSSTLLCLLGTTAAIAFYRGRQVRIIVKNDGPATTLPLKLEVNGQIHHVPALAAEASYRWVPDRPAQPSPVILRGLTQDGRDWLWKGGLVKSGGGSRLILHITAEGSVDLSESLSIWQDPAGL